jgi:hypothetical protein
MVTDNEDWIVNKGDEVIQKRARLGRTALNEWEQLVYCLWVADYMMCNAGDFANAEDMYPDFQSDAVRLAHRLGLNATREAFSLPQEKLQQEYFSRFDQVCDELKQAEPKAV